MQRAVSLLLIALVLSGPAASRTVIRDPLPPGIAPADQAPIALLVDLTSRQTLYARAADRGFLPASMTKAMTMLVAFDLIKAGRLREDSLIMVRPETAARWSGKGTTLNLRAGESVRVGDLLAGVATASANDAAVVLAEGALGSAANWVTAMNARARGLRMTGSQFGTPSGFPDRAATYVTARDMVKLAEALITEHPTLYRRYIGQRTMVWRGQKLFSHDPFAGAFPGGDGIKTGHTREAGYTFLGAAQRDGRRLVVVIGQAPSEAARASAAKDLTEWGYGAFVSRPFLAPGWSVGTVEVQDGDAGDVAVAVPAQFTLALPRNHQGSIQARIVYDGPVRAPIAQGAQVAWLEVRVPVLGAHRLPLVAMRPVAQAGPFDRIVNGLLGLFR